MRGADILVRTLAEAGVDRIFSLSGNQIMPIYDACIDANIEIIHTRHEAAAVFMADAYAQLTGNVGVALVTAAPGFANALGALFTATHSESPVLLLSGDSPVAKDGCGAFQELDQVAASKPLTKHAARVMSANTMAAETARAIRIARTARPGPVHLAIPFDVVQDKAAPTVGHDPAIDFTASKAEPTAHDIEVVAQHLSNATRPIVLTGQALNRTRARELVDTLVEKLDAPVLALESPRGLNDPSLGRFALALKQADVIVSLGKRIDFTLGFASAEKFADGAKWIVVDADGDAQASATRNLGDRLTHAIKCDPGELAQVLSAHASKAVPAAGNRAAWREEVADLTTPRPEPHAEPSTPDAITPLKLCAAVQRRIDASPGALLLCDGGEFGQWAQAALRADERIINSTSGAIGGVLCYALGARAARPQSTVFALMGDGTVGFQFAEFETAAREKLPFVLIVGNDECWNAEHQIQLRDYGPDRLIGCQLSPARYDLAVAALGGHGEFVTDPGDLDAALTRAVASGLPACVNVRMEGWPAPKARS